MHNEVDANTPAASPAVGLASVVKVGAYCAAGHPNTAAGCVATATGTILVTAGGPVIRACPYHSISSPTTSAAYTATTQRNAVFPGVLSPSSATVTVSRAEYLSGIVSAHCQACNGANDAGQAEGGRVNVCKHEAELTLASGQVTCMSVTALPGGGGVIGAVGTTVGTLCVFLADIGQVTLVQEVSLASNSDGAVAPGEIVIDVQIGLDPAGRLEFLAAATATCLVLLDTQCLDNALSSMTGVTTQSVHSSQKLPTVRRDRSETFTARFPQSAVVRLLAPELAHAAFALDIALVVVLSDGTLQYVERHLAGGSVRLLQEYHRSRLANEAAHHYTLQGQDVSESSALLTDCRALPHIVYSYHLSPFVFNVSCATDGLRSCDSTVTVNDAALAFNAQLCRMDVIMAGVQVVVSKPAASPADRSIKRVDPPLDECSAEATLVSVATSLRALPRCIAGNEGRQRRAWWAVAEGVVLPHHTLSSAPAKDVIFPDGTGSVLAHSTTAEEQSWGVSSHLIHAQSCVLRLGNVSQGGRDMDGTGLSAVCVTGDSGTVLFAAGRELYVASLRGPALGSRGGNLPLPRHAYSMDAVVECLASAPHCNARGTDRSTVVCATGCSLSVVDL